MSLIKILMLIGLVAFTLNQEAKEQQSTQTSEEDPNLFEVPCYKNMSEGECEGLTPTAQFCAWTKQKAGHGLCGYRTEKGVVFKFSAVTIPEF
jgi:uncharacterized low-complexity protein